jgi:hypothetical protein
MLKLSNMPIDGSTVFCLIKRRKDNRKNSDDVFRQIRRGGGEGRSGGIVRDLLVCLIIIVMDARKINSFSFDNFGNFGNFGQTSDKLRTFKEKCI